MIASERKPSVSVVVPTVRLDHHLQEAVSSLQEQTLDDLEIVLVVDGPASGPTPGQDDPRVRVLRLPRRSGTPTALNVGLSACRAPLFGRLDADDVAEPHRLAVQTKALADDSELVGIGSAATVIDDRGAEIGHLRTADGLAVAPALLRRNPFVHSSMLLRTSAVLAVGGYDPRCNRMQDYDLWLRLAHLGRLDNLPEPLVRYRVHDAMHSRRTPPWGSAARTVRSSRRRLAKHLGERPATQAWRDLSWTAAQTARHLGLRGPRYLPQQHGSTSPTAGAA